MENTISHLMMRIIADAFILLKQEIRLAQHELRAEIRKAITATVLLAVAMVMALMGMVLLTLTLVQLLIAFTVLPLWACYGLVGLSLAAVSVLLLLVGLKKFRMLQLIPVRTVETLKENVQWFKEVATFSRT